MAKKNNKWIIYVGIAVAFLFVLSNLQPSTTQITIQGDEDGGQTIIERIREIVTTTTVESPVTSPEEPSRESPVEEPSALSEPSEPSEPLTPSTPSVPSTDIVPGTITLAENTRTTCSDGIDNDRDGYKDQRDSNCMGVICSVTSGFNKYWTWSYITGESRLEPPQIIGCCLPSRCATTSNNCVPTYSLGSTYWLCSGDSHWDRCQSIKDVGKINGRYRCISFDGVIGWQAT